MGSPGHNRGTPAIEETPKRSKTPKSAALEAMGATAAMEIARTESMVSERKNNAKL